MAFLVKTSGVVWLIGTALALACTFTSNAWADPLSLSTAGVVGTLDGKVGDSNEATELAIAQQILDFVGLGYEGPEDCDQCYRTSTVLDYEADLSNPKQGPKDAFVVPDGYDYVLAKYDGQNAGYVLFNLPKFGSNTLPQYPANFWTEDPTKWEVSHYTTFDAENVIASVPDGGSAAALLGMALCGMMIVCRRLLNT